MIEEKSSHSQRYKKLAQLTNRGGRRRKQGSKHEIHSFTGPELLRPSA